MAEKAGKTNECYWLAGSDAMTGATGAKIAGLDSASLSELANLLEIPEFGNEYNRRMAGLKDTSSEISGNYNPDDVTQSGLEAGAFGYIGFYQSGPAAAGKQVPVIIESVEWSADVTDKQTISISLQGNGAPVELPARA